MDEGVELCGDLQLSLAPTPIDFASVFVSIFTPKAHFWTNQSVAPFQLPPGPEIRGSGVLQGVIGSV